MENLVYTMEKDKETKHGGARYTDGKSHNIYFTKDEVQAMGTPTKVQVTVEPLVQ